MLLFSLSRRPENPSVQLLTKDSHLCPLHTKSQPGQPQGDQWQSMVIFTLKSTTNDALITHSLFFGSKTHTESETEQS